MASILAASIAAQTVQLVKQRPPHYLGEPVLVRVVAEGFEEEPQPECKAENVSAGATVKLAGVSPNISQFIQSINGRVTRRRTVQFHFNFHVDADKPGRYEVGPFVVKQGSTVKRTEAVTVEFRDIDKDPDMRVALVLPQKPIYPGQRAKVQVKWKYAGDLQSVTNLRIRSPLFDQFEFVDTPDDRRGNVLPIQTDDGAVGLQANVSKETIDNRQFTVLTAERVLVADKPGRYEFAPISATMRKVVRWRRGIFGDLDPAEVRPVRQTGSPAVLTVKPLPLTGRPQSFSGAIGQGFSIEVSADRTVVRVGDPIPLRISVRGDGNLQNVGLPPLSADGGLSAEQFRLPDSDVTGTLTKNEKQFEVNVRVLDQAVSEIPAIAFSWFNPETESYETARSKPIALRVDEAKVVSADDVVSGVRNLPEESNDNTKRKTGTSSNEQVVSLDSLNAADLSIRSGAGVLQDASGRWGGVWLQVGFYAGGMLLLAIALLDRRRSNIDPALIEQRKTAKEQIRRIEKAAKLPRAEGAREAADALRMLVAQSTGVNRAEIDSVLAECESVAFSPNTSSNGSLDEALHHRCLAVAQSMTERL